MKRIVLGIAAVFLIASPLPAQQPEYKVYRTTEPVTIDGILDEKDWENAPSVGDFKFPWWTEGAKEQTVAKMLWDDDFLYLSFQCEDKHIWADYYDTNSATCIDDCAEIFWDPDPDNSRGYNMFETNCIGNVLTVTNYKDNSKGIHSSKNIPPHIAQTIQGTLNNDEDTDSGWILEIAIRFSDYKRISSGETPEDGDMWRVGLHRCGGKTNDQYSQWSPSGTERPNFHVPDDFGRVFFSEKPVR